MTLNNQKKLACNSRQFFHLYIMPDGYLRQRFYVHAMQYLIIHWLCSQDRF